jgi:hypothetical protein
MKINWNKMFSFSASESEYFEEQRDKIEFTGCKLSGHLCLNILPEINDQFRESDLFYRDRDFNRSIDALEIAWHKATELKGPDCQKCALFFQATVVQSLESIHNELYRMTKGIFGTNRYQSCYIKADNLLKRIRTTKEAKPEYTLIKVNSVLQPAYSL